MDEVSAGWHPAPGDPTQLRYWDGAQWTDHFAPAANPQPRKSPQLGDASMPTLWEGWGKPISGIGGGKYRLTAHYLYFERGTLRTDSQQVPVSALHDVDVRQNFAQKARGVGTIILHINRGNTMEFVQLVDVPNFRDGQHAINSAAHEARMAIQERQNTSTIRYQGTPPTGGVVPAPSSPPPALAAPVADGPDFIEQLEQLAKLRDNGILTDAEFADKKADILRRM